jgi:hypothetical protein
MKFTHKNPEKYKRQDYDYMFQKIFYYEHN